MEGFSLFIYAFFKDRRILFFTIVIITVLAATFLASKITFEEDISKTLPGENDKVSKILKQSSFTNKIILNIFLADSLIAAEPDKLTSFTDELVDSLQNKKFIPFVAQTTFKITDSLMEDVLTFFYENLPIFLAENDFKIIDSLLLPETIDKSVQKNYKTLISPSSFILKKYILQDPVGIKSLALTKLKQFQLEDGYEIIDGYIFTNNKRNLLLFINPVNSSSETLKNAIFFSQLDKLLEHLSAKNKYCILTEYYGSAAIAVGNARQIKQDIAITVSVAILIILLFIGWFFRNTTIPFISFFPAVFGGIIALAVIFLIKGQMSTIALGIGSVLLGIIVDYALYIFNLQKAKGSMELVIRDMNVPILMCSLTTAVAFFSLMFVKSQVLRDLGLFAGLSIIGAALFTLIILPHLIRAKDQRPEKKRTTIIDTIAAYNFESNRILIAIILVVTAVVLFNYKKAIFESDMYSMNFMSPKMEETEENLSKITSISLNSIFIFCTGENLEQALKDNAYVSQTLENLKNRDIVKSYSNVSSILISDSIQKIRIQKWSNYWSPEKKVLVKNLLTSSGEKYGFKKDAFSKFYLFIDRIFLPVEISNFNTLRNLFLNDLITEIDGVTTIMSLVKVNIENRSKVYSAFENEKNSIVIDWKEITSRFVNSTKTDFDLLVKLCMVFVTITLILAFGRIETGIITAIPMFFSWIWTLGFMGLFGIKFNIFNIVVSTFVFGLGVDYAILMMRGLLLEFKSGQKEISYYKTSIFLSSFTTVIGVGVLLLAKHPSLNSIALVSILGLISVVLISYTIEPILFNWLIEKNGKKRVLPITFADILFTVLELSIGLLLCFMLNILFILVLPLPITSKAKRKIMHNAIFWCLNISAFGMINIKKKLINDHKEDFKKPSVIISNHQSHIDLPLLLMLNPKIIVLTNKWVWNNPLYALFIRYLGFYSVTNGFEPLIDKLRNKVEEGYSVLIFPEGTRSSDSSIKRFHKGAFLLAEELDLDIVPIIIHGAGDCMNKGENHLKSGSITMKIFPRIKTNDKDFGQDYHERTKSILRFYRNEYQQMKGELETPLYFKKKIIRNYIYKGPVLEWYVRIKLYLETNYEIIHKIIPLNASVVDIGCGYGMISYMLNFTSDKRTILGIDYDKDKIELANNCISKNNMINFIATDAETFNYPQSDVFLLSDVLHYLTKENQDKLLDNCIKHLNPGGIIIIRDADADLQKRQLGTRYTEFFSTRFGFNKALNKKLYFFSSNKISELARRYSMNLEIIDNTKFTSNKLYILRH